MENQIIKILKKYLGEHKKHSSIQYSFVCPKCKKSDRYKLQVNVKKNMFHCWVCEYKGRNIVSLLKNLQASVTDMQELAKLLGVPEIKEIEDTQYKRISLPCDFNSLLMPRKTIYAKAVYDYAIKRKLTPQIMAMYNLGYSLEEKYLNYLIIPSYNISGELNYFQARNIIDDDWRSKFLNPHVERNKIIPFELYVDWNEPIIIVEGFFDINHYLNCLPLLGSAIVKKDEGIPKLVLTLLECQTPKVFIMLDPDAIKKAHDICRILYNYGIEVWFVDISPHKDPGVLSYSQYEHFIENAIKVNEHVLFQMKMRN